MDVDIRRKKIGEVQNVFQELLAFLITIRDVSFKS